MSDITFIVHLRKDTEERAKNVEIVTAYYRKILPLCKFIIIEDDKVQNFEYLKGEENIHYIHFYNEGQHNKSKGYNIGLSESKTDIVCFLDIDCILSKQNIEKSIETLNTTNGLCIGYNGTAVYFKYDVKNKITSVAESLYDFLESFIDVNNIHVGYTNADYHIANTKAVGGALFGFKTTFTKIGGFNPNFKGWGYEDNEIIIRAHKLKTCCMYVNTSKPYLFHLPHIKHGHDVTKHSNYDYNLEEYLKIRSMSYEEIQEYINTWK